MSCSEVDTELAHEERMSETDDACCGSEINLTWLYPLNQWHLIWFFSVTNKKFCMQKNFNVCTERRATHCIVHTKNSHFYLIIDTVSAVVPMLTFLTYMVSCLRKILPTVTPDKFSPWVTTFGREMITFSSRLPLVSGFYKLLATVLTVCKDIGYFKVRAASSYM